jgi:transposase
VRLAVLTVIMDSHTHSEQAERIDVVETGRRRRWSEDEKLKIVLESLQAPRQVSATARRYGIARSQLLQWRRSFRAERTSAADQPIGFVPAMVVSEPEAVAPAAAGLAAGGAIEIDFANGARMRLTGAVDATALRAAILALAGGRVR